MRLVTAAMKESNGIGSCSGACVALRSDGASEPVKVSEM
jgi:hypothetical protein